MGRGNELNWISPTKVWWMGGGSKSGFIKNLIPEKMHYYFSGHSKIGGCRASISAAVLQHRPTHLSRDGMSEF